MAEYGAAARSRSLFWKVNTGQPAKGRPRGDATVLGEVGEMATIIRFTGERAPCGKIVGGGRRRDEDDDGLRFDSLHYDCGCRESLYEFHDGSVHSTIVRHDGRVLVDERGPGA
jgi:hypothetical protein